MKNVADAAARDVRAALHAAILNNVPLGLAVWRLERDADPSSFRLVLVNDTVLHALRLPREQLVGKTLLEVTPDALDTGRPQVYAQVIATGRSADLGDVRFPQLPDRLFHIQAFALPDRCVGLVFDEVTEHRRTECELRQALDRMHLVNRATNEVVYDWDIESNAVSWSGAVEQVFGYRLDDVAPTLEWWLERIHPDDRRPLEKDLYRVIAEGGQAVSYEYRFKCADGRWVWLLDRGYVVRIDDGRAVRMIGAVADISRRHELEEQLRHSQKMEAVGRLAGGVAHDFNNLLTAMLGYAEILADEVASNPSAAQYVEEIRKAGQSAAGVTRQLLALSRRQVLQAQTIDVNEVVASVAGMLRRLIGEQIELDVRLGAQPKLVRGDSSQLEQVLVNLAVNARDAMPAGGRLAIEITETTIDTLPPTGWPIPGSYVVITVSDTGVGMDESTLAHLFEPFFTTKPRGQGTGLGLATVYGIVKQSGGWIDVDSAPDRGTTFTIYFPQTTEPKPPPQPKPVAPKHSAAVVLVVEDEKSVQDLVRMTLERRGYTVLVSASGEEALEVMRSHAGAIDLLLVDVVLPGMTGDVLASRVRAAQPAMKTLFMTGYVDDQVLKKGQIAPEDILLKPFTASALLERVATVLHHS